VRININKNYCIPVLKNVSGAPVAGYVYTPLPLSITAQWMIVKHWMKWFFFEKKKPLIKLAANLQRNLLISFLKQPMKFYSHYELR